MRAAEGKHSDNLGLVYASYIVLAFLVGLSGM
jgi:hypothetical protein